MTDLISQHLDIWTTAIVSKSRAGRGNKSPSPAGEGRGEGNPTSTRNAKYTAYGIKKLRELILELAVRGKLVPQDPNDEPAGVLLEQIALEKNRLFKEGKIKKQNLLPEINDDEKSFGLPSGWEWVRLQDVSAYIQRGKGPKYADQGQVRVISQKCIQWNGFDLLQAKYVDDDRGGAEKLNNWLSERPATLECPRGQSNGAEDVQKTEKKTFTGVQSQSCPGSLGWR